MGWSSGEARRLHRPTTVMITNNNDEVSEVKPSTGPAMAGAVVKKELFVGIRRKREQLTLDSFFLKPLKHANDGLNRHAIVDKQVIVKLVNPRPIFSPDFH